MSGWIEEELGHPWVPGVSDCWAFARDVWRRRFGRIVAALPYDPGCPREARTGFATADHYRGWQAVAGGVDAAQDGDAVVMARGRLPCHIGISVAGGILHSLQGPGTIWTPTPQRLADLGLRVTSVWRSE